MTKLGQIWTDSVAYVALILGAGLSIAGNVADTYRTRQGATDVLDIVMAVAWPALVILMVEIFVSARWTGLGWPMQVLRWLGTLSIGAMAMRVSWVHLNDLMSSRGQETDVAVLGPLAIDALAIMATALILAGRGQVNPVVSVGQRIGDTLDTFAARQDMTTWTGPVASEADAKLSADIMANPMSYVSAGQDTDTDVALTDTDTQDLSDVQAAADRALSVSGREMADEAETWLSRLSVSGLDTTTTPAVPVVSGPVTPRTPRTKVDETRALDMIQTGIAEGLSYSEIDSRVGQALDVHPRTIKRLRDRKGLS